MSYFVSIFNLVLTSYEEDSCAFVDGQRVPFYKFKRLKQDKSSSESRENRHQTPQSRDSLSLEPVESSYRKRKPQSSYSLAIEVVTIPSRKKKRNEVSEIKPLSRR